MRTRHQPAVFLSSTFIDLASTGSRIAEWFSTLFSAELIVMEAFGSDSAPPDVNSVRKVREAIEKLDAQGRVHEIPDPQKRLNEIAKEYARKPEGTRWILAQSWHSGMQRHSTDQFCKDQSPTSGRALREIRVYPIQVGWLPKWYYST